MKSKKDLWGGAAGDARWAMLVPPAPGDLRIVQAMVNTAAAVARTDEMASPQAAADWLARWGLLPAATEISESGQRRLIDTRDGLRALTRFNNGLPWDADAVARLNKAAASAPLKVEIGARSTRFEPAFDGVDGALGMLARIVVAARMEAVWRRLKLCRGDDCGLSYYDASARCLRRWCSMERCGNLSKVRAFRRRHRR
jgi:predicted RNA-binding Zn ribbon-like protein